MLLHYDSVGEFKKQFYKDLLTAEHQITDEIKIDKLSFPNGVVDDQYNFWGYTFKKNGKKYLVPSKMDGEQIDLADTLPIFATNGKKVAHRGEVYWLIEDIIPARPKPHKYMSFNQLLDSLASLSHSNPIHQKINWFVAFTQMLDRANFRISTPPGFGKDSTVDIFRDLIGGATTIVSPTLAKLEFMTTYKWLAINEVLDITKAEWKTIEQFLLDTGAFKTEVAKHSRSTKGVKEILTIKNFSLSLLYNDITNYSNSELYFDNIAKDALIDRFPPLRFYGTYTEDFTSINGINIKQFAVENADIYKQLISTFTYFKENLHSETSDYKTDIFDNYPERWKTNINKLLTIVDLYCSTQEEFDYWANEIKKCMIDYSEMIKYPRLLSQAAKIRTDKETFALIEAVEKIDTFTEKNKVLVGVEKPKPIEDTTFWEGL